MSGADKLYKNTKRLESAKDARQYMSRTINAFDDGRIAEDKARTIGYLIKVFLNAWESQELEERLEELEEHVEEIGR